MCIFSSKIYKTVYHVMVTYAVNGQNVYILEILYIV